MASEDILGSVKQEVEALIQGRQIGDSRLYDAIRLLNTQLEKVTRDLEPAARQAIDVAQESENLVPPLGFTATSTGITVRFKWLQAAAHFYEVRRGTVWETADFLFRTPSLQGDIDPLLYGNYTFLLKSMGGGGNYSADFSSTTLEVPLIPAPAITVSVIDNNVLLYWTEPTSLFKIDYYLVGKVGGTAGRVDGTFTSIFEVVAGNYKYRVTAVDIAGNIGIEGQVEAFVNAPPDFALQDTRISGLNGTRVNVLRLPNRPSLLACWATQTWQEHFVNRSWLDIEDQLAAGYPIYIQPTAINGSYEEEVDYGVVISNTIVTVSWNTIFHTPAHAVGVEVQMQVNDGSGWSVATSGASQYFRALRYLRVKLLFTAEDDHAFIELYHLTLSLNAKRENDGGEVYADATHAGGTTVNFTKPFKDVESITCTTKSPIEPYTVIFDFNDVPSPTGFKVFVFDTMGARVSRTVDWKARGVV